MADGIELDGLRQRVRDRIQPRFEVRSLDRLHQAQVSFGQGKARVAGQAAEQLDADPLEGRPDHREMPGACDPVEDNAGDPDIVAEVGAAGRDGRRRLDLALHIEHQHDRPAEQCRDIGGRAASARAVEQAHHAFGDDDVRWMPRD